MTDAPATRRRSTPYLDVATLAALVRDHRRTGVISDDLARALVQIASGVWERYQHVPDKDDFVQDAVVHLLGNPLKKCDPHQHLFNYFTTCTIRLGLKLRDKAAGEKRRFNTYAADRVSSGEPVPRVVSTFRRTGYVETGHTVLRRDQDTAEVFNAAD